MNSHISYIRGLIAQRGRRSIIALFYGILGCTLSALLGSSILAAQGIEATDELTIWGGRNISPRLELLADPGGGLTLLDVSTPAMSAAFRPNDSDSIDIGFSQAAWWGRFMPPARDSDDHGQALLEFTKPSLSRIELFIPLRGPDGRVTWQTKTAGEFVSAYARDTAFRCSTFIMPGDRQPDAPIYFRIKSLTSVNTKVVWWSTNNYIKSTFFDNIAFGAIYGALLAMGFYNLILFISLRDKVYGCYVAYIFGIMAFILSNYGHMAFLPFVHQALGPITHLLIAAYSQVAGVFFVRAFLDLKRSAPFWQKILNGIVAAIFLAFIPCLWGNYNLTNVIISTIGLVCSLCFLTLAGTFLARGFRPALYLVIAWSAFMVGVCLFALGGIVIPRTPLTVYLLPIGAVLDAIFLSFALADRIRSLTLEKARLDRSRRHFMELATRDALTGLYNRRHLFAELAEMVDEHQREGRPFSLLMLDVDDFKAFNDAHGHPEGDKVLVALARVIGNCIRSRDRACRYGGEEFLIALPDIAQDDALKVAKRIQQSLGRLAFGALPAQRQAVTVSIGVASLAGAGDSLEHLLSRADKAMYAAKGLGKNRTQVNA